MSAAQIGTPLPRRAVHRDTVRTATRRRHLGWLAGGIVMSFCVPFVFADLLEVPRDLYYGIYVSAVALLAAGWMRDTGQSLPAMLRRRRGLALAIAGVCSALAVVLVINAGDAAGHPGGLTFAGALIWRGVIYGVADGVLLTAFPILVVFAAFAPAGAARRRIVLVGALALATSIAFTAVYHLGYADFRGEKVLKPMAGDLIWAPSTLVTLNPVGAPLVHATMHVTAVAHSYDTDLFLPPH